ncbi:hypothetical protein LJC71_04775 [Desulfosarcina sp. OttesenSCG-928-A07]|nr:hypothetical protein [Desulfosarcina sp. OttesenSCG-928-G17]MDL2329051.1 hypothetical protein [Desulfosarcina sp. OttesenSCG-928-A07]
MTKTACSAVLIAFWIIPLACFPAQAARQHPERWYQAKWCDEAGGKMEVRLPDGTRCDCLTDTHAVEFDFGNNWAESIGQALYYAVQTGKKPGVVLILENQKDYKYWIRLNTVIQHYGIGIDAWMTGDRAPEK